MLKGFAAGQKTIKTDNASCAGKPSIVCLCSVLEQTCTLGKNIRHVGLGSICCASSGWPWRAIGHVFITLVHVDHGEETVLSIWICLEPRTKLEPKTQAEKYPIKGPDETTWQLQDPVCFFKTNLSTLKNGLKYPFYFVSLCSHGKWLVNSNQYVIIFYTAKFVKFSESNLHP